MTSSGVVSAKDQYNHWAHYYRVLAEVLDDARDGKLATRWREELHAYALGLPRLRAVAADGCLMVGQGRAAAALADIDDETDRLHQLYSCAVLDVTRRKRALWEPYAAQGDWRGALEEWYADRIATLEQSRSIDRAEAARNGGQPQAVSAQQRDVIEAKYRAGIHAGSGTDSDWREWFIGRIESWQPTDLPKTVRRRMMGGDNFSAWEQLPHSWTATQP
jgi:hypothetical protein